MKKTFIWGVSAFIIGLLLVAFGVGNNGFKAVYWQNGLKVDANIHQSKQIKGVQEIELKTSREVLIRRGTDAKVSVSSTKSSKVNVNFEDHKLTIDSSYYPSFIMFDDDFSQPQVEITIPENVHLKTVTTDGDADLTLEDVDVETLDAENNYQSGDLTLSHVNLKNALNLSRKTYSDITLSDVRAPGLAVETSGDLTISHSRFEDQDSTILNRDNDVDLSFNKWKSLNATVDNGDLNFRDQAIKGEFIAKVANGDIEAQIDQKSKNAIIATVDSGDHTIYGVDRETYGNRNQKNAVLYRLTANNGDVEVTY